ncbi:MAG: 2,3-bisphosphoglycerate-independent phosphoglycerate mutase, partial [Fusobacteria bacterium]|nr:2,3-bisphosphoglycerate-independent phosphoglycerate mutase [Fusobacteriota bacterium]
MKHPVLLMILDGFGLNPHQNEVNAIKNAHPENFQFYWENYPHAILEASGEPVGLPDGQMGNSEVGHLNIGAGRVVYQPLVQISKDVRDGDIEKKAALIKLYKETKASGNALHLTGLLSDGGVHSHINHVIGLVKMAKNYGIQNVYVHAILDGRDTEPTSGIGYVKKLEVALAEIGLGKIATVSGRFYQMDRDKRWDRVEKAYDALVNRKGEHATTAIDCVEKSYINGVNDEFVLPTIIDNSGMDKLNDGDGFLCFNFRPDRARELTKVLTDRSFKEFDVSTCPTLNYVCMTQYDETFPLPVVYAPESLSHTFGEIVADKGLNQLRIAETEKYAHVTFFFNGGIEKALKNEDRVLVNSPKVATYDLQPEMSA